MKQKIILLLISMALLCAAFAPHAMAVGTLAGTKITNKAYVDYTDAFNNPLPRLYSNVVETTIIHVAAIEVTPPEQTETGRNSQTTPFLTQLFNMGNDYDTITFYYEVVAGSDWTPTSVTFFKNGPGGEHHLYEPGIDIEIAPDGTGKYHTDSVMPDDDADIWVIVNVPDAATAPDNSRTVLKLTAISDYDGTATDYGTFTVIVSAASLATNKTVYVEPDGREKAMPGDIATYTITLTNNGTAPATGVTFTDPIPPGVVYVANSIQLNGALKTDAQDADGADYGKTTPGAVTVAVGNIPGGGGQAVIVFKVKVNDGIPAGQTVTNQASITFMSGANEVDITTNGLTFFIEQQPAVDLSPVTTAATGDSGQAIVYRLDITNEGNVTDVFDLTYTSTAGWTWIFWYDADGNGIPGTDGDFQLSDTDGDGTIDTGSIAQNVTEMILATTTIPPGTSDKTIDNLDVKATSSIDPAVYDTTGNLVTTVAAPVLSITKSVDKTEAKPGDSLVYTITVLNSGTGNAKNVVVSDITPVNTVYMTGSIKTGQTLQNIIPRTDAQDGDGGSYDSGTHAIIAGGSGITLGPQGQLIIQFTVTVL